MRHPRAGMTLIELMLVMALMALIMGVGLGLFASLRPGERAAIGLLQSTLRQASNAALHHAAPASVHLEPGGSHLHAEVLRVIGTWHFENEARVDGAFDLDGSLDEGGKIVPGGWQGRSLSFAGEPPKSEVSIPVQGDPAWDLERGFLIELALRRETESSASVLTIGSTVTLDVGSKGELSAAFLSKVVDSLGVPHSGEKIRLRTETGVLGLERWHLIRLGYDVARFTLLVDGVEIASVPAEVPVWKVESPLVLGGGDRPFAGSIDALSVRVVESGTEVVLPGQVVFARNTPGRIVFAPGGSLDLAVHKEPVNIELEFADSRRQLVRVELYGTVQ